MLGGAAERPLPPPAPAAARLQQLGRQLLAQWADGFGVQYPALRAALRHAAEDCMQRRPHDAAAAAQAAQARREVRFCARMCRMRARRR